jgi:anaerobic selenocysteine-containing dehydrogenase
MCGLMADVDGGRVTAIRGDDHDPFSRGHLCVKAAALADIHDDPARLRQPMRRTNHSWEAVSWEEALHDIGRRLGAIRRQHGRDAVALHLGNPIVHDYAAMLFARVLVAGLGTRNLYTASSVDGLPHLLTSFYMFGHRMLVPVPDIDRTDFFLVLGANPVVSNGSVMSAPGIVRRLRELKRRGGRLVVVDPRRTETASHADLHLAIRPGTDALLLFAMIETLFAEGRVAPGRLASVSRGLDELAAAATNFSPEQVATAVGIPADTIRQLARDFAAASRAVAYGRIGVCTQPFGALTCWLIAALNFLTGNLDREGGSMFTTPVVDLVALARLSRDAGHHDRFRSRVRGVAEFGGELPLAVLAEEIDTPGPGRVRALITYAGNLVVSAPNGRRLKAALGSLDLLVSIDMYRNHTNEDAHYILPPTSPLEHDHYDLVFRTTAVRNGARFSSALLQPPASARHDWQILLGLWAAVRSASRWWRRLTTPPLHALLAAIGPTRILDAMIRIGPHGDHFLPWRRRGLTLRRLRREAHGIDLGPLEPSLPGRLRGRRIDVAPAPLLGDVQRLRASLDMPANGLVLISRRRTATNNTWMNDLTSLRSRVGPPTLLMHPDDARARGLAAIKRVKITAATGTVIALLELTDELRPGVVSLPFGHGGVRVNDLTNDQRIDAIGGTAGLSGVTVTVSAIEDGASPPP